MEFPIELFEALLYQFPHLINGLSERFGTGLFYICMRVVIVLSVKVPLTLNTKSQVEGGVWGLILFGFCGSCGTGNPKVSSLGLLEVERVVDSD